MDKDNYTMIPNDMLEALYTRQFSPLQFQIISYVIRHTLGWHKDSDIISISKTAKEIGRDFRKTYYGFCRLEQMGIIEITERSPGRPSRIRLRDTQEWAQPMTKTTQVRGMTKTSQVPMTKTSQVPMTKTSQVPMTKTSYTKEKKETIKKIKETPYIPHDEKPVFMDRPFNEAYAGDELKKLKEEGWE